MIRDYWSLIIVECTPRHILNMDIVCFDEFLNERNPPAPGILIGDYLVQK